MLTMNQVHDIRSRFLENEENISQITDALHLDWKTAQRYVDMTGFNLPKQSKGAIYEKIFQTNRSISDCNFYSSASAN